MTIALAILRRYWLHMLVAGVVIAVCAWLYGAIYEAGGREARADCAEYKQQVVEAALADVLAAEAKRDEIAAKLAALQNAPKAAPVIKEVIRANPSGCNVPKPVADSLREAIERANKAAG